MGDEGKGSMTDYLSRKLNAGYVIRHNGGAQAAHFVVINDKESGEEITHCFSQFGSGTFNGAKTLLSNRMLIDPLRMMIEAEVLEREGIKNPLGLVTIVPDCLIITPFHAIINQMQEISRGDNRHGSCGIGVGQTVEDSRRLGKMSLVAKDMFSKETLRRKLDFLWRIKIDFAEQLVEDHPGNPELVEKLDQLTREGSVEDLVNFYHNFVTATSVKIKNVLNKVLNAKSNKVYEGAQGTLLDEVLGFHPYVTYSFTTFKNADEQIRNSGTKNKVIKIGVIRAYGTRHGRGPFVTEDVRLGKQVPDKHNGTNNWQESFRIGWFDLLTARYALECAGGIDFIALTNLDRLDGFGTVKVCIAYECGNAPIEEIEKFFECETNGDGNAIIKKIKFEPAPSSERQRKLSEIMMKCKPVYIEIEKENYIEYLEHELGIDIAIVSMGPKASDKIERKPLLCKTPKFNESIFIPENKIRDDIGIKPLS